MWLSQSYDQRRASAVMVVRYSLLALIIFMLVCTLLAMVAVLVATQYTGLGHTLHDRTQGKCTSVGRPFRFPFAPVELTPNYPGSLGFVGEHVLMFAQLSHSIAVPGRLGVTAKKKERNGRRKRKKKSRDRWIDAVLFGNTRDIRTHGSKSAKQLLARFCHVTLGKLGPREHSNLKVKLSKAVRAYSCPGFCLGLFTGNTKQFTKQKFQLHSTPSRTRTQRKKRSN